MRAHRRLAALALLALVGAACSRERDPAEERVRRAESGSGDLVVGAAWPWEARKQLLYGQGMELALEEVNRAGGIGGRRLRILREDDRESVDEGSLVAQRFAQNPDVVAVIGHLQSYVTVPAAAVYDLAGIPVLSPASTDPELTRRGYRRVFRATFTDAQAGREMAEYAGRRGYRQVAIYYVRNPYGRSLANAFEERADELGIAVMARQSYDPNAEAGRRGAEQTAAEWRALQLDAVFLAGEVPHAAVFIAELRRQGIRVPVLGGDAMGIPDLFTVGGEAVEGTVVSAAFHPDDRRPEVRRFVAAFRARFGTPPDAAAALGYDAVQVMAQAMRRAGKPTPERIAEALHGTRGWHGVTGVFSFAPDGDLADKPVRMVVAHGDRWQFLDEEALPAGAAAARPR
ncbi:MAG TPA: ABC transporter substrate-binding protein [Longimicrobiaceae bacterium]|jgi:branched-chain amino acid transport system substrate-binding protein